MTFEKQIAREIERMQANAVRNPNDGLLILLLKSAARPYLWIHENWFFNWISAYRGCGSGLLKHWTAAFNEERDGGQLLRFCIDLHNILISVVLVACYAVTFVAAQVGSSSFVANVVIGVSCLLCLWRCYVLFAFIGLLHSHTGYQPQALIRALMNTLWHYAEVIIAFGVGYLACAAWCGDSFSTGTQKLSSGFVNSAYFSFVTISTLGYGDFSPQTTCGRVGVVLEVMSGLFLLVVVLQRAMAEGQRLTADDTVEQLDEKCLGLMRSRGKLPCFPAKIAGETLSDAERDHALERLTSLGVLRFEAQLPQFLYAYHWTPLGDEILRKMGILVDVRKDPAGDESAGSPGR